MSTPPPQNTGHFAADDSAQMIKLLELEIINRRAKRLIRGEDQSQSVRMFGVVMLFVLLLVVMGMTWYAQTASIAHRPAPSRRLTASPAPAASIPAADQDRPPVPTDH